MFCRAAFYFDPATPVKKNSSAQRITVEVQLRIFLFPECCSFYRTTIAHRQYLFVAKILQIWVYLPHLCCPPIQSDPPPRPNSPPSHQNKSFWGRAASTFRHPVDCKLTLPLSGFVSWGSFGSNLPPEGLKKVNGAAAAIPSQPTHTDMVHNR